MEKEDTTNPFSNFETPAKNSSSSKSHEDSSEGSSESHKATNGSEDKKKKRTMSLFGRSSKKEKKPDTEKKPKEKDNKKQEIDLADDSRSNTQSEEVAKPPRIGGNRSMSEASPTAIAAARARLIQETKPGPVPVKSNIVISPRRNTGPRIASALNTWTSVTATKPEANKSQEGVMGRSRSASTVSHHRTNSISPRQEGNGSPDTNNGFKALKADKPSRAEALSALDPKSNPTAKLAKGDGQSPWMSSSPSGSGRPLSQIDTVEKAKPFASSPSLATMVAPGVVNDAELRQNVRQLLTSPQRPMSPSRAKITIQENTYVSRGMPTVTIETGQEGELRSSGTISDSTLAGVLPFPELNHIPATNSFATQTANLVASVVDAIRPPEPSLLESIQAGHQRQTAIREQQANALTSLVIDTAIRMNNNADEDEFKSLFDTIDDKYTKTLVDGDTDDELEREIQDVTSFMAGDIETTPRTTIFESSSSSSSESSSPTFPNLNNSKMGSVSMPLLPTIPEPEAPPKRSLHRASSSEDVQSQHLQSQHLQEVDDKAKAREDEKPKVDEKLTVHEKPKARDDEKPKDENGRLNPPSTLARRLSNAGVVPALAFHITNGKSSTETLAHNTKTSKKVKETHKKQYEIHADLLQSRKETQVRLQKLAQLVQTVHTTSQRRNERTNTYIQTIVETINKQMIQSNSREQKLMQTQRQFLELLKAVSVALGSMQGPQQSLKTTLEKSNEQTHMMLQAMLNVLQNVLQNVSHYQEELKVVRAVSNKQVIDHVKMVDTFQEHMSKIDLIVEGTKAKYKSKEAELKKKLKATEAELVKQQTLNRGIMEMVRSKGREITIDYDDGEPQRFLTNGRHRPHSQSEKKK